MIASYTLSNCGGLAIEEINEKEEKILVRLSVADEETPKKAKWYKLYSNGKGYYFYFKGTRIHLSECLRTDIGG